MSEKSKKKTDIAATLKKHPKEVALGAAGLVVVVLALKKKAAGGMAPAVAADPSTATGPIGGGGDTGGMNNLDAAIGALNTRIDYLTGVSQTPIGVVASTPPADVAAQFTAPAAAQLQPAFVPMTPTINPQPTPDPFVVVVPPSTFKPAIQPPVLINNKPTSPALIPKGYTSSDYEATRAARLAAKSAATTPPAPVTLIRPTVSVQGLLGTTTAPRSARGD